MNIDSIRNGLAERLASIGLEGYSELPPQAEFPCAIVPLPIVQNFHTEMSYTIARLEAECRVFVGRGEIFDAQVELGKYLSTDTTQSVLMALEAKTADQPWLRLSVKRSSEMINDGDAFGVIFFLELDA